MDQLGHTDPKLTLRIYARAMRRDADESELLRALAGAEPQPGRYPPEPALARG
jgi:integrase